jgi:hypothetical protein
MPSTRKSRIGLLSATAAAAVVLAACSSASAPSPRASTASATPSDPAAYANSLEVPLVQCFIDHHLIPAKLYRSQSWYQSGRVVDNADFANWWGFNEALTVRNKQLDQWTHDAAFKSQWPTSMCGPRPSPATR